MEGNFKITGKQFSLLSGRLAIGDKWVALNFFVHLTNPVQEGGPKRPPTSFSHVTSTNVRISPKNFLTFGFSAFSTLVKN